MYAIVCVHDTDNSASGVFTPNYTISVKELLQRMKSDEKVSVAVCKESEIGVLRDGTRDLLNGLRCNNEPAFAAAWYDIASHDDFEVICNYTEGKNVH